MDPWRIFCELCKLVVKEQNIFLEVLVTNNSIEFQLMPLGRTSEEEE